MARRKSVIRALFVAAAVIFITVLADHRAATAPVRWTNDVGAARYAILGNSEANAILTHTSKAAHFWESRATLIDRRLQLNLALERLPDLDAILVNVMPAEMAINPYCLTFRTPLPAGLENSQALPRRSLRIWRHARATDLLLNPHKLLEALDQYIALDPTKAMQPHAATAAFRPNGARDRRDPVVAPSDVAFDAYSAQVVKRCAQANEIEGGLNIEAHRALQWLGERTKKSGIRFIVVVTPMHPVYRNNLDAALATIFPDRRLSTASLIQSVGALGWPMLDHSRIFDGNYIAFMNGDHLSSHGELQYGPLFAQRLKELCADCT